MTILSAFRNPFRRRRAAAWSLPGAAIAAILSACSASFFFPPASARADANTAQQAARLNNLGTALMNQQLLEKAEAEFAQAYTLDPALTRAAVNQGIALVYLQRLAEAEPILEKAAVQDPSDPHVWYALGILHRNAGENEKALEDLKKVLALRPRDADAHYFAGSIELELQQTQQAEEQFQEALRLNPLHASAEFGLARALQRLGQTAASQAAFQRFTHLTQAKIGVPLAHTYGDEGRYSLVENSPMPPPQVQAMAPLVFVPQAMPKMEETGAAGRAPASGDGNPQGGACLLAPAEGGGSYLFLMSAGAEAIQVYRGSGAGAFVRVPAAESGITATGEGVACAVGDYDNDGLPDLAVALSDRVLLFKNMGQGRFRDVTASSGIHPANLPAGITFVDIDHDGDLDLFVTGRPSSSGGEPNRLWRNNGDGTFTDWTAATALGGAGETVSATLSDLNNDRAVDLLVTGSGAAPTFFANPREGAFPASPLYSGVNLPPTRGVVVLDFNKDGWMDVALTHAGAPGITLWRNVDGKRFERVPLPVDDATGGWGLAAADIDNDGWIDLVAALETAHGPRLRAFRNLGPKGFADVSKVVGLDRIQVRDPRAVIAADVDGDGDADLIVSQAGGDPIVLRNDGGNRNHSLLISLKGLADNKTSLGVKVEVFAGGDWQKFELAGGAGYLSQGAQEILAGLGQAPHADLIRLLWPTGVPQDETAVDAKTVTVTELDRRGSSCPTLFAWNGSRYQFVSDVIGAGVVGHWVAPHTRNAPDPAEWVKVPGDALRAYRGMLSLRFGEPMEEVNYLDQVRLVAIDHPVGSDATPEERFLEQPPFASGRPVVSASVHPPAGAWDSNGREVGALLRYEDHRYVHDFRNLPFAGFANPHTLTLDLGAWNPAQPLRLLLDGYVEYFSASSMYAAWQAGLKPVPPYLEVQQPDGSWVRILDDMGFPAGLQRTIVVDLTGRLPAGARKIRLTTNLQIYWDRVRIDNAPTPAFRLTEIPLRSAELAFRGYPKQIEGKSPGDLTYDYQQRSQTGPFVRARGRYTAYGQVAPLLRSIDDSFVVFGSGEDIDLEFSAASLPALRPGWRRDYFFYANGFVKDMDFYEASPFTVASMPFHGMKTYPDPAGPQGARQAAYQLEWNDRFDSGRGALAYSFDYLPRKDLPDIPGASR